MLLIHGEMQKAGIMIIEIYMASLLNRGCSNKIGIEFWNKQTGSP